MAISKLQNCKNKNTTKITSIIVLAVQFKGKYISMYKCILIFLQVRQTSESIYFQSTTFPKINGPANIYCTSSSRDNLYKLIKPQIYAVED